MRRWQRSERGQLELGAGILVLLGLLATPLLVAAARDVDDWRRGRWERQEPAAQVAPVEIPVFASPPMPAAQDPLYACFRSRAGSLQWGGAGGWTHPDYPRPTLTGNRVRDEAAVAEYTNIMRGLIADANFGQCQEEEPPPPGDPPPVSRNVSGTYQATLAYQGGPPGTCNVNGFSAPLTVSHTGVQITITMNNRPFSGSITPTESFEATHTALGPTDTMRGQFFGPTGGLGIRSGYVSFGAPDADTPCAYTFDAQRTGN